MLVCPDCSEEFDTKKSLGGHYGRVHEGCLPQPDDVSIPDDKEWEDLSHRQRAYYRRKDKVKEQTKERRKDIQQWFYDYKSSLECSKCDENRPRALSFHHTDDDKDIRVSQLATKGYGKETILEEIEKCIVLCANCHRVHHTDESR